MSTVSEPGVIRRTGPLERVPRWTVSDHDDDTCDDRADPENPQSRALLLDLMRETVAVGRAHGVPLPENSAEQRLEFADGVSAEMTSSMHHDLERGNRLEVRWLSGGVVVLGKQVGVETPLNRAVADILAVHANGRRDR